jgi:pteridine reductase
MQHDAARPVALITGAARRIGAVIARTLHAAGYDLALHCRSSYAELESLVAELEINRRDSTIALQAELGDADSLAEVVDTALARFGRLDALVNNASQFFATPLETASVAQWDELLAVNARAPFFLALAAARRCANRAARSSTSPTSTPSARSPITRSTTSARPRSRWRRRRSPSNSPPTCA